MRIAGVRVPPFLLVFGASLVCASAAAPCTVVQSAIPSAIELIERADVIVVAVPREVIPKSLPRVVGPFPSGDPNRADRLRFDVTETLKGKVVAPLLIQGRFTDRDDFNNVAVPLNSVRPEGLGGSCFASSYRRDAAYLLILQRTAAGELSPYWVPVSRVNDQIRPNKDPWLEWVRSRVARRSTTP